MFAENSFIASVVQNPFTGNSHRKCSSLFSLQFHWLHPSVSLYYDRSKVQRGKYRIVTGAQNDVPGYKGGEVIEWQGSHYSTFVKRFVFTYKYITLLLLHKY
jgi:hypothetical protein